MKFIRLPVFLFFAFFVSYSAIAAEFNDGQLRLVLHEKSGRFSLYSLEDGKAIALFSDEDPRTSFLSVMVNDRFYKMGDAFAFKISLSEGYSPSFVFQSAFMTVTENFFFTGANAVKMTITLENRGDKQVSAGARFLLDTKLGEGLLGNPFSTNKRTFSTETLLTRADGDRYWTDKNDKVSLSGSIVFDPSLDPDSVHFANWKKLSDVSWKAPFQAGRNFSSPPYSIRDTAVCYYYEPARLGPGERRTFGFVLALNNEGNFSYSVTSPASSSPSAVSAADLAAKTDEAVLNMEKAFEDARESDLAALRMLISQIQAHIDMGVATEEEMAEMEFTLNKLRAKYGSEDNFR